MIQQLSGVLRSRITDEKRHELEGWQDGLQELQFYLQSVLRLVRSVGDKSKRPIWLQASVSTSTRPRGVSKASTLGAAIPAK